MDDDEDHAKKQMVLSVSVYYKEPTSLTAWVAETRHRQHHDEGPWSCRGVMELQRRVPVATHSFPKGFFPVSPCSTLAYHCC